MEFLMELLKIVIMIVVPVATSVLTYYAQKYFNQLINDNVNDELEATLEKVANKKTSFGANFANATDTNYPSMSLLKTELYDNSGNSKFAEAVHDHIVSDITDFSTAVSGFEESTNNSSSI